MKTTLALVAAYIVLLCIFPRFVWFTSLGLLLLCLFVGSLPTDKRKDEP